MASIPLPALDVRPPAQQPSPLAQYAQLMNIRNQQQLQPLQQQEAQNSVQAGQLENQQKQQQMADQKAMTTAMQQWDGKDYNDLIPLVVKNGASANAVMGLRKNVLDMQTQISTQNKNNADAAQATVTATKGKNDLVTGALTPLLDPKQTPDEKLPQALMSTIQGLTQSGLMDPQHAQAAAQIAQSGNPDQIRQGIDAFSKTLMAHSQIMEDGLKQAQTQEAQLNAAKTSAENAYYQQHGGAPGVPAEQQQMNDWLSKNPGKGPSDFAVAMKKIVPAYNFNLQQGALSPQAQQMAGQMYAQTGTLPQGMRSPAMSAQILNNAASNGATNIAGNKAEYGANAESLKKLQTNYDQVNAFESTAEKNMGVLQTAAQKIPDLGAKFANVPVRMLTGSMIGTENMASFKTALATAQTEAAKVLNSSNASGVLSDSARHELQDLVDGNMTYPAMVASLNTLKQDMGNRRQAYQQQIGDIQNRIKGAGASAPPSQEQQPAADPFAQFGGKAH